MSEPRKCGACQKWIVEYADNESPTPPLNAIDAAYEVLLAIQDAYPLTEGGEEDRKIIAAALVAAFKRGYGAAIEKLRKDALRANYEDGNRMLWVANWLDANRPEEAK